MLVTKQLMVAIDFHSMFLHTVEVNGYQHCLVTNVLLFFCVKQKKQIDKGLEELEGEEFSLLGELFQSHSIIYI